ncbi:serralysin [Formosimonas limnophila]|uniref:Serralysin n=1 Tax=Formosimonas limnophila TaxID=1384487 RepID=A0A8J3CNC5_9BURK|nr:M10 family metallopeptidase [Formosimonas limnophila]GHA73857.1 serralysin [Formosimonas limnophila]
MGYVYRGGNNGVLGNRADVYSFTGDQPTLGLPSNVDYLLSGTKWGSALSSGLNLTYSFSTISSTYPWHRDSVTALSTSQRTAVADSLENIANVTNLTFTQVIDTSSAVTRTGAAGDLRFANISSTVIDTAAAFFPNTDPDSSSGDVFFGGAGRSPESSTYDRATILHEIGHALGLRHPHDSNQSGSVIDQLKYTVMSYRAYQGQSTSGGYGIEVFPTTLMLNDIAALQRLYGVNTTYQTGNNTYTFGAQENVYQTIYDAGGQDNIDASNQIQSVKINLNSGEWSEIGASFWNGQQNVRDCLTIAYGCVIENATGSSNNDILIGNSVANQLVAGSGADTLYGGLGHDAMYGQDGNDVLYGEDGNDTLGGGVGDDNLQGGNDADRLYGEDGNDSLYGQAGDDFLAGLNGNDYLSGEFGNDRLEGGYGNDTLFGSIGADTLYGEFGKDVLYGEADNDYIDAGFDDDAVYGGSGTEIMYGNEGNDLMFGEFDPDHMDGGVGNDTLYGGIGNDGLFGESGNDVLVGGWDNDVLSGGQGSDIFVFDSGFSVTNNLDRILDFTIGEDKIALDDAIFTALFGQTSLMVGQFNFGANFTSGRDADDRVIYDTSSGGLYYDADGSGAGAAQLFAQLSASLVFDNSHFQII